MIEVVVHIKPVAVYQAGRHYALDVPKNEKELHYDYEKRTWRNRAHATENGFVFIPPMCFKKSLRAMKALASVDRRGLNDAACVSLDTAMSYTGALLIASQPKVMKRIEEAVRRKREQLPSIETLKLLQG